MDSDTLCVGDGVRPSSVGKSLVESTAEGGPPICLEALVGPQGTENTVDGDRQTTINKRVKRQ